MLDKFKKLFASNGIPAAEAATTEKEAEEMALTAEQTALAAKNEEALAELTTQFAQVNETLTALQTANAELVVKLETATAALAEVEAAKQAVIEEAKAAKLAARKEKIVAAVGDAKADTLMAAFEGMDDAAFEAVVSAMTVNLEVEAKTPLFTEQGIEAEVTPEPVVEESLEMKIIKSKFNAAPVAN